MKFVHIEDYFIPSAGYQINLLARLQAMQGHEVVIVASEFKKVDPNLFSFFGSEESKDDEYSNLNNVRIIRVPLIGFYSSRSIYKPIIFKIVDELDPDVLFVHGEDTLIGIQYILKSSKLKYPLVLDCHMLEMASKNQFRKVFRFFYKNFISKIIIKNNIPLIRTVETDYVEKCLGIPLNKTVLLPLGTDTVMFQPNIKSRDAFRKDNNISKDDFVIIYAGKLDIAKGGLLLANAIKEKLHTSPTRNIVFLIVGNTIGKYGDEVEEIFSKSKNKILRFKTQDYSKLAPFYQSSDLAVYPRECSLSFFDAQASKLPVVFESNEINDLRAKSGSAFVFEPGNIDDFREKIISIINMDHIEYSHLANKAREYVISTYDFVPIAEKITDLMVNEANKFNAKKS